ncbi:MAG: argininosuccinate lyase [Thermodesulfobacteriota bacterium]
MAEKPWDGRFSEKTNRIVETFTASIDVDKRLYTYDIEGSIAHLKTLEKAEIISEDETATLIQGLVAIKREIDHGRFEFDESLEDIHMHIEARLLQEVGKVAQKLHTARSRNDQVVLDVRMYLRDNVEKLLTHLEQLKKVLVALASDTIDVVMPGYTHLQPAQPVLFAHHIMAYYEMFKRDSERLADGLKRINVMPLGSAALAGTTYPIDRHFTAELLGFPEVSANSMDSVADRDFIIEFLAAAGICMVHFSRLSEELILWSSPEFGFVEIPDAFATGSSIMPQKKNPDVPELVRGKTGSVFGDLMSMLTLMKSLPMAYNRDMQEDKLPLFRTVDTLGACVEVYTAMLPRLIIKKEVMEAAATRGFLNATDMADYLVVQGMPFRKAHACVGKTVGYALEKGMELHDLNLTELQTFSALIKEDIFDFLSTEKVINRRRSFGGTAKENVAAAITTAEQEMKPED